MSLLLVLVFRKTKQEKFGTKQEEEEDAYV